ncbi:MAG: single-stranded-DNA-specific exonuclease [Solirubrobacteraceae bacterium]|nr:single-stranded-DNA-specific exonuclease [Solirubrobacteraceae bacterium]
MDARFDIAPYAFAQAHRLSVELGVSHPVAQVLARRGLGDPAAARAFLAAEDRHPLDAFGGLREAASLILGHVAAASWITVHGDYDVDGVSSTAILVRALRSLGARVDWFLPSRTEDGYGLAASTVERLADRGTRLLVTADCAITAVDEVAHARALGMDVVVTDHHAPRADGVLPDAPIVHPRLGGGNPCGDLCAAGVAYKLAGALLEAAGLDPALADEDLDLVALATVADVVPLHDENRALVRAGLKALAATRKPGLRALMAVSRVDPSGLDSSSIGFRLAPRLNAAGRIARADASLELLLTGDEARAKEIADELDALNRDRRDVETRILFEAEAQVRATPGEPAAYVLAGEGWHPGVIGIVAARIAERHHRPAVLIAVDAEAGTGTGSGRSIPAFDLLAGLGAGARHLLRHGGHRAAAGLTIEAGSVDAFREAFQAYAAEVLDPDDLVPVERVDAIVPGDLLGLGLAEELAVLEPFGAGNPAVALLVPAATVEDPRPLGGEGRHLAFSIVAGGARSRAVRFGGGTGLPAQPGEPVDVSVRLEANAFNGTIEPRLVVRRAQPCAARTIELLGEPASFAAGLLAELDAPLEDQPAPDGVRARALRDVRGSGVAGLIADLVATGEPVLVVCAHTGHRARSLGERLGGFALCTHAALARDPGLASPFTHLVALDPPVDPAAHDMIEHALGAGFTHLAWGAPELGFAHAIHEWEYTLREPCAAVYRALRATGGSRGEALEAVLRGDGTQPRTPALAGRVVRILTELGLADLDRAEFGLSLAGAPARTSLERSAAFVAYRRRLEGGQRYLTTSQPKAA